MVTDYEAAWIALGEFIAGKTQHGREGLLGKMAELASEHRVPAGELSRLLRLHGVEVERARSMSAVHDRSEDSDFGGGLVSPADRASPDIIDRGGHDGDARSSDGAGRRRGRDGGRRAGAAARA